VTATAPNPPRLEALSPSDSLNSLREVRLRVLSGVISLLTLSSPFFSFLCFPQAFLVSRPTLVQPSTRSLFFDLSGFRFLQSSSAFLFLSFSDGLLLGRLPTAKKRRGKAERRRRRATTTTNRAPPLPVFCFPASVSSSV
jgi:hypothetical protein